MEKNKIEFVEVTVENAFEAMKNRRDYLKKVLKPAEKAKDELEKATATEKVRLQGAKEPKVPNLKPYTESKNVKDRKELGELISEAKANGRYWTVKRCLEEGYRYTFISSKEAVTEKLSEEEHKCEKCGSELNAEGKCEKCLKEAAEEESEADAVDISFDELVVPEEGSKEEPEMEVAPEEECSELEKVVNILKSKLNCHPGEEEGTFILCLMGEDGEEKECIKLDKLADDDIMSLNAVFFEPEEFGHEHEENKEESEEESAPEEEVVEIGVESEEEEEPKEESLREEGAEEEEVELEVDAEVEPESEEHESEESEEVMFSAEEVKEVAKEVAEEVAPEIIPEDAKEEVISEVVDEKVAAAIEDKVGSESEEEVITIDELPATEVELELEEPIEEASSAEKRAYRNGGYDTLDLDFGKALARIKDPHERAMLLHQHRLEKSGKKMSDRAPVAKTLDRKMSQAVAANDKKFASMEKAGFDANKQVEEQPLEEGVKISLDDLTLFKPWGGAKDVWELIVAQDKLEALDKALENMYPDGITATDLNDILWFEKDWIVDAVDLKPFVPQEDAVEVEAEIKEPETSEEEVK